MCVMVVMVKGASQTREEEDEEGGEVGDAENGGKPLTEDTGDWV